jgi:hypothetical protein
MKDSQMLQEQLILQPELQVSVKRKVNAITVSAELRQIVILTLALHQRHNLARGYAPKSHKQSNILSYDDYCELKFCGGGVRLDGWDYRGRVGLPGLYSIQICMCVN